MTEPAVRSAAIAAWRCSRIAAALVLAVGASLFCCVVPRPAPHDGDVDARPRRSRIRQRGGRGSRPKRRDGTGADRESTSRTWSRQRSEQHRRPETAAVLQKNLLIMNDAIEKSSKALEADPQNAPARPASTNY